MMKILTRRYVYPAALMTALPHSRMMSGCSAFSMSSKNHYDHCQRTFVGKRYPMIATISSLSKGSSRLSASIVPDEVMASSETSGSQSSDINNNNMFDGEVLSFTKNLVAVRVSDAQLQAYSAVEATKEVSNGIAGSPAGKMKRDDDMTGKTVFFRFEGNEQKGVIVCQRPPIAFVLLTDDELSNSSVSDHEVLVSDQKLTVKASDSLIGKVVDCFGNVIGGLEENSEVKLDNKIYERAIFATIPQVKDIALINKPLLTGIAMCDALAPIGRGQNMLVVGQKNTGKRDIVIDTIANQVRLGENGARCIYACTVSDEATRNDIMRRLDDANLSHKITVVGMKKSNNDNSEENPDVSAEAVAVCGTACALAEAWALNEGINCFVVIDNLSSHKSLWEHSTRTLIDMYGMESVVADDRGASSEMRAYYSALIQRSAQYNAKNGGGSVTIALLNELPGKKYGESDSESEVTFELDDFSDSTPKIKERIEQLVKANISITPQVLKKIQIPIPTNKSSEEEKLRQLALIHTDDLISMSDGQIWLSEDKYLNGQRPALDPQQSITRVGIGADTVSFADAPAIRKIVKGLRFEFNQAYSLQGAANDEATNKQLRRFNSWMLSLHQTPGNIRSLAEECICMYAANMGALDKIVADGSIAGTEKGDECIKALISSVAVKIPEVMNDINSSQDLTDENKSKLNDAIKSHFCSS